MRRLAIVFCAAALVAGLIPGAARAQLPTKEPADYVDPMIGTLAGGFSFPGPAAPYGMVQLSPDTEGEFAYTGYQYGDTSIRGFSHHHIQSMGVHSNGDLPFMPTVGPVLSPDPRSWMSPFDHATEEAQAGYYRVLLERYGILAELTAGERVGMHRYTFPPSPQSNVILDIAHNAGTWHPQGPGTVPASLEVTGDDSVWGSAEVQGYKIHFAAQFDRPFASFTPLGPGGYATFDTTGNQQVLVKVGVSFVSRANALENLQAEKPDWDFDALRAKTRAAWNSALQTIEVSGGTDAEKTSFYTALYHAQHHPNIYQDVNGEYMGHDDQVHVATDHVHYANFSLWDTYRGENQLLATIDPHRYRDMMLSLLDIYNEGGRFPQWAMNDAYPDYMEGDPIQPTIVDGYCRGVLDDSYVDEMYAALRSQAWDENGKRSATESGYQEYHQRGYMSGKGSDGSGNFEYAIADFSLALMADSLGKTADRDELLTRADNYRELINPDTGFAHPRNADGTWMSGYDPMAPDNWKEGTGWQYTWLAPQDLRGLFDLVGSNGRGGDPYVTERLDTYFSTAAADNPAVAELQKTMTAFGVVYVGNQHAPSNEHDVHAPYLYDYIGQPWKTQKIMRGYQMLFRPTPDGLPGNDDLGSMSAWFVWSALGFYPVQGGAPVYSVGSPMFEQAVITPVGGAPVTVEAPGASVASKYVQSAQLGTGELDRPWFTHDELFKAGDVSFEMGPLANESWGADPKAAPPSISTHPVSAFGCPARPSPPKIATQLEYVGAPVVRGSDVELAARLTDESGSPLSGKTVTFEILGQTIPAQTDSDGVARTVAHVPDHGHRQTVLVRFAGDETNLPSETTTSIIWKGKKR
ncbi:MAG TPA: GH92 family glycosyl hydrolase [Actinomycetota bacterium]|nr:GH92 family glycosyl hydrolase [Actinomycetota bacterium]